MKWINQLECIVFLLVFILFQSCENEDSVTTIHINLNKAKVVSLNQLAKQNRLLKLGDPSKGDPTIYPVTKILFANDRIYVFSREVGSFISKICCYDKDGNFLKFLGGYAEGPGSINDVIDVDCYKSNIELIDFIHQRIIILNKDLHPIDTMFTPEMFAFFKHYNDKFFVFDTDNSPSPFIKKQFALMVHDKKNNKIKTYLDLYKNFSTGSGANRFFINDENKLLYWRFCDPNIYQLDPINGEPKAKYKLDYGALWLDVKNYEIGRDVVNEFNKGEGVYKFSSVIETKSFLYVFNNFRKKLYFVKYDKSLQKTEVFQIERSDAKGGLIPRLPPLTFIQPSTLVFALEPENVYLHKSYSGSENKQTQQFLNSFNNKDNPPLLFVELK